MSIILICNVRKILKLLLSMLSSEHFVVIFVFLSFDFCFVTVLESSTFICCFIPTMARCMYIKTKTKYSPVSCLPGQNLRVGRSEKILFYILFCFLVYSLSDYDISL